MISITALQENLEKDTETLHELVEGPLDKVRARRISQIYEKFKFPLAYVIYCVRQYLNKEAKKDEFFKHRSNVTNYAAVTSKFMQNLLDGIENALTTEMPKQTQPFKRARTSESNY